MNTTIPARTTGTPPEFDFSRSDSLTFHFSPPIRDGIRRFISIGLALLAASSSAQTYTLTQINPPAGTYSSTVETLNNYGQVIGNTSVKSGRSTVDGPAFVWSNGVSTTLPSLPGESSATASGISDSGMVVGYSRVQGAVWWLPNGSGGYSTGNWNSLLPSGSTMRLTAAVAVSRDGQFVLFVQQDPSTGLDQDIVGQVTSAGGMPVAFSGLWLINSPDGSIGADGFVAAGLDITHDGAGVVRVTGFAQHANNASTTAFLWRKDVISGTESCVDLDPSQTVFGQGVGVNNQGEVVGNLGYPSSQAYFWNASLVRQQFPTLGGARSWASSINNSGIVVGWSQRSGKNSNPRAFISYTPVNMIDLNTLKSSGDTSGFEITAAYKINDVGHILAHGVRKSSSGHLLLKQ